MRTIGATVIACFLAAWPPGAPVVAQDRPQTPVFRASTELVVIETQVVAGDGQPIQGLTPNAFEVLIDGRRRPVVSADLLRAVELPAPPAAPPSAPPVSSQPPNPPSPEGRIIVLAIDQASFPVSAQAAAREAATRVVDRVAPQDHLGMIAFPGAIEIAPTREHQRVRAAIARISGVRVDPPSTRFSLSVSEASALKGRDPAATKEITSRECRTDARNPVCAQEVIQEGGSIADAIEHQAMTSISGLHGVIGAVAPLAGRKTLIVVSAGLPMSNRPYSRPNLDAETDRLARRAAAANVNLYVFYMNVHFLRHFSAAYGKRNYSIFEDITLFGYGLERFADNAGGAFFQVDVGPDSLVDRVLRETSAFYLLAVRPEPAEHDGKEHFIRVNVNARGATVRYRRIVTIPRRGDIPLTISR